MENLQDLKAFLSVPKYVVITSHRNPDGDAIGSSLGLYHFLNKHGHTVRVVFPSEYPEFVAWLPDAEKIHIYDVDPDEAADVVNRADIVFCLDFNSLDRIDKLGELISPLNVPKVLIDHHLDPDYFAEYMLWRVSASSTSELIYDFMELFDGMQEMDKAIGECLYTGILTDTGSFKYNTSPRLFKIVGDMLERAQVDDVKIQDLVFNCMSEKHLRLLGHCLKNRMEILPEYQAGIITLTRKDYEYFDIQRGDTEGIVNFLLKIKGIKMAAFITEQPTIVKISLRSKGDLSVEEIAKKHFKGGGHKNAAGGSSYQGLRGTVLKLKEVLPQHVPATLNEKQDENQTS